MRAGSIALARRVIVAPILVCAAGAEILRMMAEQVGRREQILGEISRIDDTAGSHSLQRTFRRTVKGS